MPHRSVDVSRKFTPFAFGSDTVSDAAVDMGDFGFSAGQLAEASRAVISANVNAVNFRYDGSPPTAALGFHLADGKNAIVQGSANIAALEFIKETAGTDAVISIILEKIDAF